MKYTINDIKILHPFIYEPTGLEIPYEVFGERKRLVLSRLPLMELLKTTGMILGFDEKAVEVKKPAGNWVTMEHYVQNTFDDLIAHDIVLHYLNNTATKPEIQ
jgi:hypothetical protein